MFVIPHSVVSTASSVHSLGKAAWRIGFSLQQLDQSAKVFDIPVRTLNDETRSLGAECDLLYTELDDVVRKSEAGSLEPDDVHARMWNCLATQVEETSRTVHELEKFVNAVRTGKRIFTDQVHRPGRQESGRDLLANMRGNLCRLRQNLRVTLLLIKTTRAFATPQPDGQLVEWLENLNYVVDQMKRSIQEDPRFGLTQSEATLLQCAHEVIVKARHNVHNVQWVNALDSIRSGQRHSNQADENFKASPNRSEQQNYDVDREPALPASIDDYDDDLGQELAQVALDTGNRAFEAQEWDEADSLLQEALRAVQQLPQQQRKFCDLFDLHYKLAISAYHTQEQAFAEEALKSFLRQTANSDEQRRSICNAMHLLSQLYIQIGHIERARAECERALNARRRMFGKQSDASMESMALMAHIYVLLNQQPRAKIYLAMIPEERRDAILALVEETLGPGVQHLDFASLLKSIPELVARDTRSTREDDQSIHGDGQSVREETRSARGETLSIREESELAIKQMPDSTPFRTTHASPPSTLRYGPISAEPSPSPGKASLLIPKTSPKYPPISPASNPQPLSRQEILVKVGCQPRDAIEEAVCSGDAVTLASLLHKRKVSWRAKFSPRVHPERVTALHFAALFGEVDMARRLLAANFNINEVPHGYSTPITPLTFAVGARRVDMVSFLLSNGARPPEPDTWSILAGQLLAKAWLEKTLSDSEKEIAISRIVSIFAMLLKYGWNINSPYETSSGKTVLHRAVTFLTGDYTWDPELRKQVAKFLCESGADPWVVNAEGKTPWDLAKASGDQDLLLVLGKYETGKERENWRGELAELSG